MTRFHWLMLSAAAAVVTVWTVGSHDAQGLAQDRASPRSAGSVPVADRQVVVEFFTSQGCSSCPPSDRLAARLATEPGVLVIQRPVTYWDRLGWTDTLGKEGNTSLQRSYAARRLGGRNGVYTPQAVIGGEVGLVGSQEAAVRREIAQSRRTQATSVRVKQTAGGFAVTFGGTSHDSALVSLVGLDSSETVVVSRGENGGRTLRYTNIWKGEQPLGGKATIEKGVTLGPSDLTIDGADRYAVVVRQGPGGPITGAAMLR